MALFPKWHIKPEEMGPGKKFTHYGKLWGLPVYIGDPYGDCNIAIRNWWPEFVLDIAEFCYHLTVELENLIDPTYDDGGFRIIVEGELK